MAATECDARIRHGDARQDVLREDEFHPEAKCADAAGDPCNKRTLGLLQRRQICVKLVRFIGKESNQLEAVDAGLVHSDGGIYTEYVDKSPTNGR